MTAAETGAPPVAVRRRGKFQRASRMALIGFIVAAVLAAGVWEAKRLYVAVKPAETSRIPTTSVKRGDLTFTVSARASLRGGNSEMLTAPLAAGGDIHITSMLNSGDVVKANDTVIEFDPTDQEFKLKEAEADVAENKWRVEQAKAQAEAQLEEDRYSLAAAESAARIAEMDVRKNPILPAITARQNDLALKAAQDRLNQIRQDIDSRKATNDAAITVQQAALGKAEVQVATAKKNIDSLTVRAHRDGYVSLRQNTSGNFMMWGMALPIYQVGDTVRGGMAVAEIPDLKNWEAVANIGELDRGHLSVGQKVDVSVVALPGKSFTGKVADLGGTAGSPWDRHFECKIHLDNPSLDLRPGMSANIVITTDVLKQALWVPAQALFESGSRAYVYVPSGNGFTPRDVKMLRRSESQVVISGVNEGQAIALSNPEEQAQKKASSSVPSLPK